MLGSRFGAVLAATSLGGCWLVESTPEPSYEKVVLTDTPVGYWRVGEGEGPTALDASGHGHNYFGTYVGTAMFAQPGAIINDGDTAVRLVNGEIQLLQSELSPWAGDFTIEAWIAPHAWGRDGYGGIFIAEKYDAGGFRSGWRDTWAPRLWTDQSGGSGELVSPTLMTRDAWNHVVFTKAGDTIAIYLNGAVTVTASPTYKPPPADRIVCWGSCQGIDTNADFDELAIYDRALSPAEVARHHEAGTR